MTQVSTHRSADHDRLLMFRAIREARKSKPEDDLPHPLVGAVVLMKDGTVRSGHRGELGKGEHAEYTVLEKKLHDDIVAGATVYTTLEPCTDRNHPKVPCADRLIQRRVKRVLIGMLDPDSRICGRGVRRLRDAGVEIQFFPPDLAAEVEDLNRSFTQAKIEHKAPRELSLTPPEQAAALDTEACEKLARAYALQGDSPKSVDWGLRAFHHHVRKRDSVKAAQFAHLLAKQYRHQGFFNDSLRFYASAEEYVRRSDLDDFQSRTLLLRIRAGRIMVEKFLLQGDCRAALNDYDLLGEELQELAAIPGLDPTEEGLIENYRLHWQRQQAEMYRQLGFYQKADSIFHRLFEDYSYYEVAPKAWSLLGEGESKRMLGSFKEADRCYAGAEQFARKTDDYRLLARVLRNQAELIRAKGDVPADQLMELSELADSSHYLYGRIYFLLIKGGLALTEGTTSPAQAAFLEATSLCRSNRAPFAIEAVHATLGLGESYRLAGLSEIATGVLKKAVHVYEKKGLAWGYLRGMLSLSEITDQQRPEAGSWGDRADWAYLQLAKTKQRLGHLPSVFVNIL